MNLDNTVKSNRTDIYAVNTHQRNKHDKVYRSAWLCNAEFCSRLSNTISNIAGIEQMRNAHNAVSFLPHVTLFSGTQLSEQDCHELLKDFHHVFPHGLNLKVESLQINQFGNPAIQLILRTTNVHDLQKLVQFEFDSLTKKTDALMTLNSQSLHASLLYKFSPKPTLDQSIQTAYQDTHEIVGKTFNFNQFAITHGHVLNRGDVTQWSPDIVEVRDFDSLAS